MVERLSILQGDCRETLKTLPNASVQCCVTSPPYWGLRDYGVAGQIGQEPTPEEYVAAIVAVFREVHRALKDDGTLWLNLGDSYTSGGRKTRDPGQSKNHQAMENWTAGRADTPDGLKPKDLIGIPWMVAFALRADGWYLRSDIIWSKPNPMPESVTDRPTKAHEYIFLLSKSQRYFYDSEAIKEPMSLSSEERLAQDIESQTESVRANGGAKTNGTMKAVGKVDKQRGHSRRHAGFNERWDAMEKGEQCSGMRNKRSVWSVAPANFKEAHFATFPPDLIKPCILAGSRVGDVVLDPFGGSGTTGMVALELGRRAVLCELNPEYVKLSERRCDVTPGLALETTGAF